MEQRISEIYKLADAYTVVEKFKGSTLKGKEYEPLFTYFSHLKGTKAFHIYNGTFVTTDQGTGVVHQAPYFGEVLIYLIKHIESIIL